MLDESDAFRRGLKEGDQLMEFAGRAVTSTNMYKNVLGIYPKEWRVPLKIRRNNAQAELLVRLMGNIATEKEKPNQPPMPGDPPAPPKLPVPKGPVRFGGGLRRDAHRPADRSNRHLDVRRPP